MPGACLILAAGNAAAISVCEDMQRAGATSAIAMFAAFTVAISVVVWRLSIQESIRISYDGSILYAALPLTPSAVIRRSFATTSTSVTSSPLMPLDGPSSAPLYKAQSRLHQQSLPSMFGPMVVRAPRDSSSSSASPEETPSAPAALPQAVLSAAILHALPELADPFNSVVCNPLYGSMEQSPRTAGSTPSRVQWTHRRPSSTASSMDDWTT